MPSQLREIGCHVQNHATQWHEFQHEIQLQKIGVAWIKMTLFLTLIPKNPLLFCFPHSQLGLYGTHRASNATSPHQISPPDSAAAASSPSTRNPTPRIARTPSSRLRPPRWGAGSPRSTRRRLCAGAGTGRG